MELLLCIVLLSMIVLSISQIDIFSYFHVLNASRRAKIDNEISLALEHMTKNIVQAVGNEISDGADKVVNISNISGDTAIKVYIDANGNGQRDAAPPDRWIAYRFTGSTVIPTTNRYQIWYCPQCTDDTCTACTPDNWGANANNAIAKNISVFTPCKPVGNSCVATGQLTDSFLTMQLTTCWDPASADLGTHPNGTMDNPCVDMKANIKMPSVSTN